jgi:hypothetical protein
LKLLEKPKPILARLNDPPHLGGLPLATIPAPPASGSLHLSIFLEVKSNWRFLRKRLDISREEAVLRSMHHESQNNSI